MHTHVKKVDAYHANANTHVLEKNVLVGPMQPDLFVQHTQLQN